MRITYLLIGRHGSAPSGLGALRAEGLVVVSSAGLLAEAPGPPVGVHAPESVVGLSWAQLHKTRKRLTQLKKERVSYNNIQY